MKDRPEARRSPRFPFYASAEIVELRTETRLTARTSELSRYGCYLDMLTPLPLGIAVSIKITYGEKIFEATGRVIYAQPNMGMGVVFDQISPECVLLLEGWMNQLA